MRRKGLMLFVFLSFSSLLMAQGDGTFWSRVVVGGGLGAQFGSLTVVQVAPNIGYKVTDEWITGIGFRYMYLNYTDYDFKTNIYGGSVYTQYYFLENFLTHAEVEVLNLDAYDPVLDRARRVNVTSVLVGGGLKLYAGGNTFFTILGLWNLNETPESPYINPIIRAGIVVGL